MSTDPFSTSVRDYKANLLDITTAMGPADITQIEGDSKYRAQVQHAPGSGTLFVVFDCGNADSPVSNPDVCQAFYLATDQTMLSKNILH